MTKIANQFETVSTYIDYSVFKSLAKLTSKALASKEDSFILSLSPATGVELHTRYAVYLLQHIITKNPGWRDRLLAEEEVLDNLNLN